MLSVLIPVYNYDITALVFGLHNELITLNIDFEIIALDDKSGSQFISKNLTINTLTHTRYELSKTNNGIAIARYSLVNMAKHSWILLLDADMKIVDKKFIFRYLEATQKSFEVIFGGIIYEHNIPNSEHILRWKYGKIYEAITADKRNKRPYKITSAANMLIKKDVYLKFGLERIGNSYGMDIFFGPQLKHHNIPVLHINNPVYHLGLESSKTYLNKIQLACKTLLRLHQEKHIKVHENSLLKLFVFLKHSRLNYCLSLGYKWLKNLMKKQLLGKRPSVKLLQFYKISYICFLDTEAATDRNN